MNLLTWLFGKREIKCDHKWEITDINYTPPAPPGSRIWDSNSYAVSKF